MGRLVFTRVAPVLAALSVFLLAQPGHARDYEAARYSPLHFKPAIEQAKDEECLGCHREVLDAKPRSKSPAGVPAAAAKAWYQALDTYQGAQEDFHVRHITTPFAREVMDLKCNTCHQGNDPREEAPKPEDKAPGFTLRKMVDPSKTCLLCHGQFPWQNMTGLEESWPKARVNFENPDMKNGCMACHGEGGFRSNRHKVNYLKAEAIEEAAKDKGDVCYGCHGGRSWYRISYPFPRHAWEGMDAETPDWAKGRPTESEPRFLTGVKK
jgi:hypothetical protein